MIKSAQFIIMATKRKGASTQSEDIKRLKHSSLATFTTSVCKRDYNKVKKEPQRFKEPSKKDESQNTADKQENVCISKYFGSNDQDDREPEVCSKRDTQFSCIYDGESRKTEKESGLDPLDWKMIKSVNLNLEYCHLLTRREADDILRECEDVLEYNTGQLARVHVYGKWHDIPRKQVAFGDEGLSYSFSNNTIPAKPWIPLLDNIRQRIHEATGHRFNFVLINRYKDGMDHISEHRDDEKDLIDKSPIASLSLGQKRDFLFRHGDSRGKNAKCNVPTVKLELEHGSLLLMNYPTNQYWYHSLPPRKKLLGARINMTFRQMKT